MLNKMAISKFRSGDFEEKMSVGGSLVAFQFIGHFKRALENFSFEWALSWRSSTTGSIRSPLEKKEK